MNQPQPHTCPPVGLCLPVEYRRCRDGDTVEVSLHQSRWVWAVRLLDCWCPESRDPGGPEATAFAVTVLEDCDDLRLFVPFDPERRIQNPLQLFTFDRVLGYLYVTSTRTLNQMIVDAGHGTRERSR